MAKPPSKALSCFIGLLAALSIFTTGLTLAIVASLFTSMNFGTLLVICVLIETACVLALIVHEDDDGWEDE
ncbi:hypothetical protein [Streptacidiphilus albus]|uniref:hypothetical protein n=1 Tax=Streptacidiphilus albus TaxID=105425 RepID=UPI00054BDDB1|nr:hypothetical protein [Streptacidiphilus albus]